MAFNARTILPNNLLLVSFGIGSLAARAAPARLVWIEVSVLISKNLRGSPR